MRQAPGEGYVDLLARAVYDLDRNTRHHILTIGGNSSADILERIENETISREKAGGVRAIFLGAGIVDSSFSVGGQSETNERSYLSNMEQILDIAKIHSPTIIVPGLTRVDESREQPFSSSGRTYTNKRVNQFDETLRRICGDKGISYILLKNILSPENLADGIHPNTIGHIKIFQRLTDHGVIDKVRYGEIH